MSEMWNASGDDGPDDWTPDVFPAHWWRSQDDGNDPIFSTDKEVPELILTTEIIVNLFRVISVCPPRNLVAALTTGPAAVGLDELTRLIIWCETLTEELTNL